jgi:hypothetical protein
MIPEGKVSRFQSFKVKSKGELQEQEPGARSSAARAMDFGLI